MTTNSLRDLFDVLVDLDPAECARRLEGLDLDDARLQQLRELLRHHGKPLPLLAIPAASMVEAWQSGDAWAEQCLGQQIGPFRLTELLGRGGTGLVFRAERPAGDAAQVVALKLMRAGLHSREAQRRFDREQAILAQLTHPNIARLIEGGISVTGVPYIAMELIEGEPLTTYADQRALDLRARLGLILTLCRAIEAAHAALVVHRDLKPSNVHVDRRGEIKVLDFGIAKLLDDDAPETATQVVMLTPGYAAPEQYRPGPVTTAADVYALGVLLGEIVTGKLLGGEPTQRASTAALSLVHGAPRGLPPSAHLARLLRGDLDAIIGTALAEEPARRYRSAGAMADDLERHLEGRPVHAHPPTRWYRMRKFLVRHRGGAALTAVLSLAVLASLALALWQANVARQAAASASAEAARAKSLRNVMLDAFMQAQPSTPGATDATVVDVVERAVATVRADRYADPHVRVDLLTRLAQVLGARDKQERSAELLAQAQDLATQALAPDDPLRDDLALAQVRNGIERHDFDYARVQLDAVLSRLPTTPSAIRVQALIDSSTLATHQGEGKRALALAEAAVVMAHALNDAQSKHEALRAQASALIHGGDVRGSIDVFEQALNLQRARYGDAHVDVAAAEDALATTYRFAGDLARAEEHARAAVAIDERAMPGDHIILGYHLVTLSLILVDRRAFPEALPILQRVIAIQSREGASETSLAANHETVGIARSALGDWPAAVSALRQAREILSNSGHERKRAGIRVRTHLAWALAMNGESATAMAELDRTLVDARAMQPADRQLLGVVLERKARIALDAGDLGAARAQFEELADAARDLRKRPLWAGRVGTLRAELALAQDEPELARAALEQAAAEFEAGVRVDPVVRTAHALLAALAADPEHADPVRREARTRFEALPYPPSYVSRLAQRALTPTTTR